MTNVSAKHFQEIFVAKKPNKNNDLHNFYPRNVFLTFAFSVLVFQLKIREEPKHAKTGSNLFQLSRNWNFKFL